MSLIELLFGLIIFIVFVAFILCASLSKPERLEEYTYKEVYGHPTPVKKVNGRRVAISKYPIPEM
jgi:hypothetical protein